MKTLLKLYVDSGDNELKDLYVNAAKGHNQRIKESVYPDSGFDLLVPQSFNVGSNTARKEKVNLCVKSAMFLVNEDGKEQPIGYYMYPRSSIHKAPLRLANSVGIIDSGYRGNLMAIFDNITPNECDVEHPVEKGQRLVQICSPTLSPIEVELVNDILLLGMTERGEGGFGSTGQ